ncbi:hypothetical protein JCGZ_05634 [Jatropha curcas]|uniref:Malectin-like domain-containing protein n=1 Tax=Jatropha curcas TaxID=180498 RepID=A0A067L6W8_JATCU|nr:hypothetical protein JCGZ_05634 [Jatropha curcas]
MLEAWAMPDESYPRMSEDRAWITGYRYNYGGSELILGYPDDRLNRIWKPMTPSGLDPVEANFTSLYFTTVNEPPETAIVRAVESPYYTESILLPFTFNKMNRLDRIDIYFTEIQDITALRKFYLYVNGGLEATISPEYQNCTGYTINTPSFGPLNVALVPSYDSTLPPIVSAIEVYTASDFLVTAGTSKDDLDGLAVLINSFDQLKGWNGEPCLPSDTVWQWLGCSDISPPRVISINLSGYGLKGPLPDFNQMKALETLNLANNSLNGPIPDFLGMLPSLQLLDLRDNDFSGDIPQSIVDNNKLTYYIDGNQNLNLHKSKKKNLALIIGLAVGIPICMLIVIAVIMVIYFSKRKQPAISSQSQGQETEIEMGNKTQEENSSVAMVTPSDKIQHITFLSDGENVAVASNGIYANEHSLETASGEDISINGNGRITDYQPRLHDIDDEELRDLLRQHGSTGANVGT